MVNLIPSGVAGTCTNCKTFATLYEIFEGDTKWCKSCIDGYILHKKKELR